MFKKLILALCFLALMVVPAFSQTVQKTLNFGWMAPTTNTNGTPLTDLGGYKLYMGSASGGPYTLFDTIVSSTQTPPTTEQTKAETFSLTAGTDVTKYFVITAYDTSGNESAYSNQVSNFFNLASPTVPGSFTISSVVGNSVTFTWIQTIPASPADMAGWRVYQSNTSGGPWSLVSTVAYITTQSSYTTSVTITIPTGASTTFYWVLASYDTVGNQSAYTSQVSKTFDTLIPGLPTNLRIF